MFTFVFILTDRVHLFLIESSYIVRNLKEKYRARIWTISLLYLNLLKIIIKPTKTNALKQLKIVRSKIIYKIIKR